MSEREIFLVAAGMLLPKKTDNPIAKRHIYLNYGLLSIAGKLERSSMNPKLIHGLFDSPEKTIKTLLSLGLHSSHYPLLLSLPSFYAVEWGKLFCEKIKQILPDLEIIAGGRWVVNNRETWLLQKIPQIDKVVSGTAEDDILNIITSKYKNIYHVGSKMPQIPLNFKLLHDMEKFHPTVEVSRGCGMGCSFCEEKDIKLEPIINPEILSRNIESIFHDYNKEPINSYFQASMFLPNLRWSEHFVETFQKTSVDITWRCETRADTLSSKILQNLAATGLKVIDIGLESASHQQLNNMGKTKDTTQYLEKADQLIKAASKLGIWTKLNILLYPGETMSSWRETTSWLEERAEYIKGVSVGPMRVFGLDHEKDSFIKSLKKFNVSPVKNDSTKIEGVSKINLSSEIDNGMAEKLALGLSKKMMSKNDYFDLKQICYFEHDYDYENFIKDVASSNKDILPFKL